MTMLAACMFTACSNSDDNEGDFMAVLMTGCSSDDDSDLSSIERSLVGCWQVVEHFNYSHQEPITGLRMA